MFFNSSKLPCYHYTRTTVSKKTEIRKIMLRNHSNHFVPGLARGLDYIKDPRLNKGLAFTLEERQSLGIHGLLAPNFKDMDSQVEIAQVSFDRYSDPLNQYLYLSDLQETNERLFFKLLDTNIEKYMPVIYTPTVGLACQKFGLTYRKPRGLFVSIYDKGHIHRILANWPEKDVKAICFTDGERILGLGDLGAYGMGIPAGKLALYTALAGIRPEQCLPITLDVGTNNKNCIEDPMYIGLRRNRVTGKDYYDFVDEFMRACVDIFGRTVLLQFEDFALANATPLLQLHRDNYCTFNDDIQGTASVSVAGIFAASRITKMKISEGNYMFLGAGSAAVGIANLIVLAMTEEGLSEKDARDKINLFDVDGLLSNKRSKPIAEHAKNFGKDVEPSNNFEECVSKIKPTALIGCSTVGGAFTPAILNIMGKNNERPIIFALSNPTHKAECTAQQAYDNTEGRCVYSSGSPFPPVNYGGKTYHTGQGNNAYIFPGVALGIICSGSYVIPDQIFLEASKSLAAIVQESDLAVGRIYPPMKDIKKASFNIAVFITQYCYDNGLATVHPKPKDLEKFIQKHIYSLDYPSHLPETYPYPKDPEVKLKSVEEAYGGTYPSQHPRNTTPKNTPQNTPGCRRP